MVPPTEGETLVLIVEDEHDNREIMRAVVEDILGYRALLASDGQEALRLAIDHSPRLVLMDLMMPVLDGFETIRQLKTGQDTASIPVVAISALSRPTDRQRALEYGADDYLSKPFDLDLLATIVERYATGSTTPTTHDRTPHNTQDWDSNSPNY
jgi:CheY-like chemotaxis protein